MSLRPTNDDDLQIRADQPDLMSASAALDALPPALRTQLHALDAHSLLDAQRLHRLVPTLELLTLLGADDEAIASAYLHALPELPTSAMHKLTRTYPGIAALLEGLRAAEQVWSLHAEQVGGNVEGLRRLLLAIVRDLRVVPILLAQQLARLRLAPSMAQDERRRLAQLTRDIHAPLANRLGIWQLKWELEDLAFRCLEPETYRRIAALLDDKRAGRERYIDQVKQILGAALEHDGIRGDVAGRPKHIYSIWKKMQKKDVPIGDLYDLRAVRILVADVATCYAALGVVHALWTPVPGEFDDYIARPKNNDYRSLHTAVIGPEGKTLEVQIRTREMHTQAELGVAAHWRYKEDTYSGRGGAQRSAAANAASDRKIEWMRRLLESHGDAGDDERALAHGLGTELVEDRVYALTPMGKVIDLPTGATPLDFAYHVHTEVGHRCRGAKVDGRIVPLDYQLRSGERVEILTAKTGAPRRNWLLAANGFLASARSRDKVRAWFHKLDRARNLQAGRELLERELRRLGLLQVLQGEFPAPILDRFNVDRVEDLQVLVALGDVGPHQVGRALLEHEHGRTEQRGAADPQPPPSRPRSLREFERERSGFTVVGVDNLLVQIARCCRPLPGEAIAGYLTRTRGLSVHRNDCPAFLRLHATQPQRVLPVDWGQPGGGHEAAVLIEAVDRKHLLKDLTHTMAQEDAHVLDIRNEGMFGQRLRLRLRVRVRDFGQFTQLLGRLERLPGVESARRA